MVRTAVFLLITTALSAQQSPSAEERAARHLESVRNKPELLLFLREMPKGGDLHNHLSGAVYAESYINYAASEGLCVDRTTSVLRRVMRIAAVLRPAMLFATSSSMTSLWTRFQSVTGSPAAKHSVSTSSAHS